MLCYVIKIYMNDGILILPNELINHIIDNLSNDDYYSIQLTAKLFHVTSKLNTLERKSRQLFKTTNFKDELKLKFWNMKTIDELVYYHDLNGMKYIKNNKKDDLYQFVDIDRLKHLTKEHHKYHNNYYFYDIMSISEYRHKYIINRHRPIITFAFELSCKLNKKIKHIDTEIIVFLYNN